MKNYKILTNTIFAIILYSTTIFAQGYYNNDISTLPNNAKNFINKYFPNTKITFIERDWDDIEVYLENGTQIDFNIGGDWKEVKAYNNMPVDIIPANVMNRVKSTYPDASIYKIEKKFNIYEIKLNNMMELYIDFSGNLLGQKFDD